MPKDNKHNEDNIQKALQQEEEIQKLLQEKLQEAKDQNSENPIGQFLLNHLTNLNKVADKAQARMIDPVSVKQINGLQELFSDVEGVKVKVIKDMFRQCFMVDITATHLIVLNEQQIAKLSLLLNHSTLMQVGYDEITGTHVMEVEYPCYVFKW